MRGHAPKFAHPGPTARPEGPRVASAHASIPVPLLTLGRDAGGLRARRRCDVMEQLTDDLLYHGDLQLGAAADDAAGASRTATASRSRACGRCSTSSASAARSTLDRYDLGGVYEDIAKELREVVEQERDELERQLDEARESGDPRRQELTEQSTAGRNLELDMLPPDLAGQVKGLEAYDFASQEAAEHFDELMDQLREQLMQQYVEPDVRGHAGHVAGGHGPHEGHDGRAEPDAGAAGRGGGTRLRRLHGALRRLLPGEPPEPGRVAGGHGPAHAGHAGHAQLHDAGAAGPAPAAVRPADGGHGPALAGRAAGPEPARRVPGHGLGRQLLLRGPGPAQHGPGGLAHERAGRPGPAGAAHAGRVQPRRARWRRTSTVPGSCWATRRRPAWSGWPRSPAC